MSNILGTWTIQPTNRCGSIWHRPWAIPTTLPSHWWFVARGFLKGEFQKISRIRERFQGHLKCVIVRSTIISEKKGSWFLPFSTPWIFRSRVGWDPMQANLMDAIRYLARCKYVSVPRGWDTRLPVKKNKNIHNILWYFNSIIPMSCSHFPMTNPSCDWIPVIRNNTPGSLTKDQVLKDLHLRPM